MKPKSIIKGMVIGAYAYLICTLIVFQYGFYLYKLTPYLWETYDAEIISEDAYIFEFRHGELANVTQAEVQFSIDNYMHHGLVPISYCEKRGDVIRIAVKKNLLNICIRVEWLPLSKGAKAMGLIMFFIVLVQNMVWLIKRKRMRKKGGVIVISQMNDN